MDQQRTICGNPPQGRNDRCRTNTFMAGNDTYVVVINNNGGTPCTQHPFQDCWSCWARPCMACLQLYFEGRTWGPGKCAECSQGMVPQRLGTGLDAPWTDQLPIPICPENGNGPIRYDGGMAAPTAAAAAGYTMQPATLQTPQYAMAQDWNVADQAGNKGDTTDEETESHYNGNIDSPPSYQGDSAFSETEGGIPNRLPEHYGTFMDALHEHDFHPILSKTGMGGLGAVEDGFGEEADIALDFEPMDIEEPRACSTPDHGEEEGEKKQRGEKEKNPDGKRVPNNELTVNLDDESDGDDKDPGEAKTAMQTPRSTIGSRQDKARGSKEGDARKNPGTNSHGLGRYRIPKINAGKRSSSGKYTTWQLATFDARQEARKGWLARKGIPEEKERTPKQRTEDNIRKLKSEIAELKLGDNRDSRRTENPRNKRPRKDHGRRDKKQRRH